MPDDILSLLAERLNPNANYTGQIAPFSTDAQGSAHFDPHAGLLGSIISALTLPGDVYTGKVPAYSGDSPNPLLIDRTIGLAGAMVPGMGMGGSRAVAAAPRVAETAAAPLADEMIAQRLAQPVQQNFRPIEYGPSPLSATADYQRIQGTNYGSGNSGSWIGRSSRFGDEDLANVGYNPRYDQSLYRGGQQKPPAPLPENPLLQENFAQMPVSYPFPYPSNTFAPQMNHTYNSRYSRYPETGEPYPRQPPIRPEQVNPMLEQYAKERLDRNQAGDNGRNYESLSSALRNLLYAQKMWGIH